MKTTDHIQLDDITCKLDFESLLSSFSRDESETGEDFELRVRLYLHRNKIQVFCEFDEEPDLTVFLVGPVHHAECIDL